MYCKECKRWYLYLWHDLTMENFFCMKTHWLGHIDMLFLPWAGIKPLDVLSPRPARELAGERKGAQS